MALRHNPSFLYFRPHRRGVWGLPLWYKVGFMQTHHLYQLCLGSTVGVGGSVRCGEKRCMPGAGSCALSPLAVSKHCTTWTWCRRCLLVTSDHALVSSLDALICLLTLATLTLYSILRHSLTTQWMVKYKQMAGWAIMGLCCFRGTGTPYSTVEYSKLWEVLRWLRWHNTIFSSLNCTLSQCFIHGE